MRIYVQRVHSIVAETLRVAIIAAVSVKPPGLAFKKIEPSTLGANPEITERVLHDCTGLRAAKRVRCRGSKRIARDLVGSPIDAGQAAPERADPEGAESIFVQ